MEWHSEGLPLLMETIEASLDIGQQNLLKWEGVWVMLFVVIFYSWLLCRRVIYDENRRKPALIIERILGTVPATMSPN